MSIKGLLSTIWSLIKTVTVVVVLAFVIRTFFIQTYVIEGPSMEPNFYSNQYLLLDKISYHFRPPVRGEVVVLHPPNEPTTNYIKRVIGLPGDTIEIKNGHVFINDHQLSEPYISSSVITNLEHITPRVVLFANQYFVLGDNRPDSKDSRTIGPITKSEIVGRTFMIVFPFAQAHLVQK